MSKAEDFDALLAVGGVALLGGAVPDRADTLSARAYAHVALEGRVVVRLTPEALGAAEDLTMDFLGFEAPTAIDAVGVVREQALGFPAWALVNDPENAQHALNLVKDIERWSRMAKSKPGIAKDGFDALAERLAGSVPRYLPTFHEQVARIFLDVDNKHWAALYFGKARDAERAYGLPIDEDAQAASFLEFALAGALTAKALSAYAKDLALRCTPAEAYTRYWQVCVERVTGGLLPSATMPADLRRLAKAAGLDPSAADQDLLRELLAFPAIARSSANFWSANQDAIGALGRAQPAVRGLLLNLTPLIATSGTPRGDDLWLSILEAAGATDDLTAPGDAVPAQARARDGAAGWLGRFVRAFASSCGYFRSAPPARLLGLVERMAPRLRSEGVAVHLADGPLLSLELVDLCLAKGIPIADPAPGLELKGGHLSAQCANAGRDLSALAADAHFRPVLTAAVDSILANSRQYSTQWTQPAGIRSILADRLGDLADSILNGGLPDAERALVVLSRLHRDLGAELRLINQQAWDAIATFDVAVPLADALRRGILDEFGWPALDEACTQLAPREDDAAKATRLHVTDQWPYLIVADGRRVVVVAHDQIVYSQDLPPLALNRIGGFRYGWANGQLSITTPDFHSPTTTWSGSPYTPLSADPSGRGQSVSGSIELPNGARSYGSRPSRAGDADFSWLGPVATDGERYWVLKRGTDENQWISAVDEQWREFDPYSGHVGARGAPEFFREGGAAHLIPEGCSLVRLPEGIADSPLGSGQGLVGWRVAGDADGAQSGTGIDGRSVSSERRLPPLMEDGRPTIVGAIRFPGAADDLAIVWHHAKFHQQSHEITLLAPGDRTVARFRTGDRWPVLARGTACLAPWQYWHFFTPRDPVGSAALRRIEVASLRTLLAESAGSDREDLLARLGRAIPEITTPLLLCGVLGLVENARHCATLAAKLMDAARTPSSSQPPTPAPSPSPAPDLSPSPSQPVVEQAKAEPAVSLTAQILSWVREPDSKQPPEGAISPGSIFGSKHLSLGNLPPAIASRFGGDCQELGGWEHFEAWTRMRGDLYLAAVAPWFGRRHRDVFVRAEELRSSGLLPLAERIRVLHINPPAPQFKVEVIPTEAGHAVAFKRRTYNEMAAAMTDWLAVEITREGSAFGAIPGWGIERDWRVPAWPWPETQPADAVRMLTERGELPWRPQYADRLAEAAGITRGEAAVWLLGFPGLGWQGAEAPAAAVLKRFGFPTATAWQVAMRRFLKEFGRKSELLGVLLPERAEDLWTTGPDIQQAADYWIARHGRQASVPGALLEAADKELRHEGSYSSHPAEPVVLLRELLDSAGRARISKKKNIDNTVFEVFARTLLWLAYRLPAGDPLRAQLPAAAELVRALLLEPGRKYHIWYQHGPEAAASVLGLPIRHEGDRVAVGALMFGENVKARPDLRPSMLSGPDDPVLDLVSNTGTYRSEIGPAPVLRLLLGERLPRLLADHRPGDATQGYPAQDPTRSVPELVAQAAAELQLPEHAAALYLMLLALPDPTDRNQAAWTGWKPARLTAARTQLAERPDLVVSGSRPRAGRSLFLPGPWLALKAPHLPVEAWKSNLLGIEAGGAVPLGVVLPQVPVPELFQAAWQRVQAGDAPSFENLSTS